MDQQRNPLVSIITPSLNQGMFIEQTITSVLKQSYRKIEYIIMDGCSTDNTFEIVGKFRQDKRLRWFSQKDEGQYDAVNKGFMVAKGEILGWINADDIYDKHTLEKVVAIFSREPDIEIIYGRFYTFREKRKLMRKTFIVPFSHKWLRRYCFTNPSVTFVRSSLIQRDGFLIDNSVPTYGDWDWFLRMADAAKKFYYFPENLGYFRIHPDSRIMKMNKSEVRRERLLISRKHNIPLSYMQLWADLIIPWIERFQNLSYLIKIGEWHEVMNRLLDNSTMFFRNVKNRLM